MASVHPPAVPQAYPGYSTAPQPAAAYTRGSQAYPTTPSSQYPSATPTAVPPAAAAQPATAYPQQYPAYGGAQAQPQAVAQSSARPAAATAPTQQATPAASSSAAGIDYNQLLAATLNVLSGSSSQSTQSATSGQPGTATTAAATTTTPVAGAPAAAVAPTAPSPYAAQDPYGRPAQMPDHTAVTPTTGPYDRVPGPYDRIPGPYDRVPGPYDRPYDPYGYPPRDPYAPVPPPPMDPYAPSDPYAPNAYGRYYPPMQPYGDPRGPYGYPPYDDRAYPPPGPYDPYAPYGRYPLPPPPGRAPPQRVPGWGETPRNRLFFTCSRDMAEDDLRAIFARFPGMTIFELKRDPTTSKSRGFGFAEYETLEMAVKAREELAASEQRVRVHYAEPKPGEERAAARRAAAAAREEDYERERDRERDRDIRRPHDYSPGHAERERYGGPPPPPRYGGYGAGYRGERERDREGPTVIGNMHGVDPNVPEGSRLFVSVQGRVPMTLLQRVFEPFGEVQYICMQPGKNYGYVKYAQPEPAQAAIKALNETALPEVGYNMRVSLAERQE